MIHAAKVGLDGICVNEHHQNAYGFMPSPNLMGSVLARVERVDAAAHVPHLEQLAKVSSLVQEFLKH